MKFLLVLVVVSCWALVPQAGLAQATPAGTSCNIEPRTQKELDELLDGTATPVARQTSEDLTNYSYGYPASIGIIEDVQMTLDVLAECRAEQDDLRVSALFTDSFLADAGERSFSLADIPEEMFVNEARLRRDSRVIAHVVSGSPEREHYVIWFRIVDGIWQIDSLQPIDPGPNTAIPNSAETVIDNAIADLAATLGVLEDGILVTSLEPVDWPDSSLGCPQPDGVYLPVVTPGYRTELSFGGVAYVYHTDTMKTAVRCE